MKSWRRYWRYLRYCLLHKWFVLLECWKLGIFWRGITHDLSKFSRHEFFPYARFFYQPDGTVNIRRDETGYYKPQDTGNDAFDLAWFHHQKCNDHHWQYWLLPKDDGTTKVLQMPDEAMKEMLADWRGAGRAQGFTDSLAWYTKNKDKMQLHPITRQWIEEQLGYSDSGVE